jgi:hypothetical protein
MSDSKQEQSSFKKDLIYIKKEIRRPFWQAISDLDHKSKRDLAEVANYLSSNYTYKKRQELKKSSSWFSPKNLEEANIRQYHPSFERIIPQYSTDLTVFLNTREDIIRAEKYFEVLMELNSCDDFDKLKALHTFLEETMETTKDPFLKHELNLRTIPSVRNIFRRSEGKRNRLAHQISDVESQLQKLLFQKIEASQLPTLQKIYARYLHEQQRIEIISYEQSLLSNIGYAELRNEHNLKELNNVQERIKVCKELLSEPDPKDNNGFSLSVDTRIARDHDLIKELNKLSSEEKHLTSKLQSDKPMLNREIELLKNQLEGMKKSFASSDDQLMHIDYVDLSKFEEIIRVLDLNLSAEEKDRILKEICSNYKLQPLDKIRTLAEKEQSAILAAKEAQLRLAAEQSKSKVEATSSTTTVQSNSNIDTIKSTTSISLRDHHVTIAGFFSQPRSALTLQPGFTQIIPIKTLEKFEPGEPQATAPEPQ